MELIKKFFADKGRLGVAIVCLLMLSVAMVSAITGETMAATTVEAKFYTRSGIIATRTCTYDEITKFECSIEVPDSLYGWGTSSTCITGDKESVTITKDTEYYECYKYYTVDFDINGGSWKGETIDNPWHVYIERSSDVNKQTSFSYLKVSSEYVEREGYTLIGWQDDDGEVYYNSVDEGDAGKTLKAVWSSTSSGGENTEGDGETTTEFYEIYFNINGGEWANGTKETIQKRQISKPAAATDPNYTLSNLSLSDIDVVAPSGYTFGGWKNPSSGVIYDEVINVSNSLDGVTLEAVWIPKVFTMTLEDSGGSGGSGQIYLKYGVGYYSNSSATTSITKVNVPIKSGHRFLGYYYTTTSGIKGKVIDTDGTIVAQKKYTADHSFVAEWESISSGEENEQDKYTVTFNAHGGVIQGDSSKTVTSGETYGELPTATYEGKKFLGWFTLETGGSKVSASDIVKATSDHELHAQWQDISSDGEEENTPTTYTVTFDANKGNAWSSTTCKSSSGLSLSGTSCTKTVTNSLKYGTLPEPTRTNYAFDGWYTSSTGGTKITSTSTVNLTGNQTLYAHWNEIEVAPTTYTITFDVNKGDAWSSTTCPSTKFDFSSNVISKTCKKTVTNGSTYGDLPEPTRTGYKFVGWYTEGESIVTTTTKVNLSGNQTLYAEWSENQPEDGTKTYSVTYYAVYGTGAPSSQTKEHDKTLTLSDIEPTRTNYTFKGWSTSSLDNTVEYEPGDIYTENADLKLYAVWEENSSDSGSSGGTTGGIEVEFNATGGSVSPTSKTVVFGQKYGDLPTPTWEGKEFLGWYPYPYSYMGFAITKDTTVTRATKHTLYAIWKNATDSDGSGSGTTVPGDETKEITVNFNANGGSVSQSSKTVTVGGIYGTLPTPTRSGYEFIGWYDKKWYGTKITSSTKVTNTSTHTLYAIWEPESSSTGNPGADEDVKEIVVKFDAQGGSVSPSSKTVTIGENYGTLPTPTRSGYTFDGWYSYQYIFIGTKVTASSKVSIGYNHTLYARWTEKTTTGAGGSTGGGTGDKEEEETIIYYVKYNANGGTGIMSNSTHTYGKAKNLSSNTFTREGYIFIGWNTEADGSGINFGDGQSVKDLTKINGDVINLYAQWYLIPESDEPINPDIPIIPELPEDESVKMVYYINYDSNGGTGSMSRSMHFFGDADNLSKNNFTKKNYIFVGWNTEADGSGTTFSDEQTISNLATRDGEVVTLYAQWFTFDQLLPDSSPQTGSLPVILVSLIGVGALGGVVYYRKKIKN